MIEGYKIEETPYGYKYSGMELPSHTAGAIERYLEHGLAPGGFLTAVIENDLRGACYRADDQNIKAIPAIVAWFYNHAPARSWGFENAVTKWCKREEE